MPGRKALYGSGAMLGNALNGTRRDTDVNRPIALAGEKVDAGLEGGVQLSGFEAWMLKQVQHDEVEFGVQAACRKARTSAADWSGTSSMGIWPTLG